MEIGLSELVGPHGLIRPLPEAQPLEWHALAALPGERLAPGKNDGVHFVVVGWPARAEGQKFAGEDVRPKFKVPVYSRIDGVTVRLP